jgi:hypothetical protein
MGPTMYHNCVLTDLTLYSESGLRAVWKGLDGRGVNAKVDLFRHSSIEAPEDLAASACQARMESVDD